MALSISVICSMVIERRNDDKSRRIEAKGNSSQRMFQKRHPYCNRIELD